MADITIYLAGETALWYQQRCGDPLRFLGCHNLTGITEPRGDTNPLYCRVAKNKFEIQRTFRGAPGLGSAQLSTYDQELNELSEMPCAFNLYVLHATEGGDDDPTNYDYLYIYEGTEVTSVDTDTHHVGVNPDEQAEIMITMPTSFINREKIKTLTAQTIDISANTSANINGVSACDDPSCDAVGGFLSVGCQNVFLTTDGASAEVLKSVDGGASFSDIASPFTDQDNDIGDIKCVGDLVIVLNKSTSSLAHSTDLGVTFTENTTPTKIINKILYISGSNIWFGAMDGYIYQSVDGGASLTVKDAGTAMSSNHIYAMDFATTKLGYAAGADGTVVKTIDGGATWTAVTSPQNTGNDDIYSMHAISGTDVVFVGTEDGNLYRSRNQGLTWTNVWSNTTTAIGGIQRIEGNSCNDIAIIVNDEDPYFYSTATVDGSFYRSVDGGNSFTGVVIPANDGLLDLVPCGDNRYFITGNDGYFAIVTGQNLN